MNSLIMANTVISYTVNQSILLPRLPRSSKPFLEDCLKAEVTFLRWSLISSDCHGFADNPGLRWKQRWGDKQTYITKGTRFLLPDIAESWGKPLHVLLL